MIAHVVPVTRLRRATTWWTYSIPTGLTCTPGSLVIISLRGRSCLGVVWATENSEPPAKTNPIESVLTKQPFIRFPQRQLIEWMSEYGFCSLSSALYAFMPPALRTLPTRGTRDVLASWDSHILNPGEIALRKQHLVLTPSHRAEAETQLSLKHGEQFARLDSTYGDAAVLKHWEAVAKGSTRIGSGREYALFAPWINLRHVTIFNPEDIAFSHEQIPYINLVDAARVLATATKAEITLRSFLPHEVAQALWGERASGTITMSTVEITDIKAEGILNSNLVQQIKKTLEHKKQIVILYNAHDHSVMKEDGTRVVLPGIETIAKRLAHQLDLETLPESVHLGTRSMLSATVKNVGLSILLSIDPLLAQETIGNQIHGWADIGRLLSISPHCIIQTRQPSHPMIEALSRNHFSEWCVAELQTLKQNHLPPFCEHIVCSTKQDAEGTASAEMLFSKISKLLTAPWSVSNPFPSVRRSTKTTTLLLHAPLGTRLPVAAAQILTALPHPWKVQHNLWHTV